MEIRSCFKECSNMAVTPNFWVTISLYKKECLPVITRNKKKIIEASCIHDIHTWERLFCYCYFSRLVRRFFSDGVKKLVVYFGLYESSLHFQRREDQIDNACLWEENLVFHM